MGTDPVLSIIALLAWRTRSRRMVLAHWCFDLYPEAAVADGLVANNSLVVRAARRLLARAYSACDLIADIGPCMRTLLERYKPHARMLSLVPWALEEPSEPLEIDTAERCAVFGEARLALFYSGSFGRAHSYEDLLTLSALIEDFGGVLAFSVRGNCEAELRAAVERHPSVRLVPFVHQDRLSKRLSAADIHVVTLREEWTGTVVPSKFFAALAVGRPVLFAGSEDSSVARWIRQFGVGWVINPGNCRDIAAEMQFLAERPSMLQALFRRCWFVYQEQFSKKTTIDRWDAELKRLIDAKKLEEGA
jgi:putative colanic acid biosynthesis glycosyltransferase WcaI